MVCHSRWEDLFREISFRRHRHPGWRGWTCRWSGGIEGRGDGVTVHGDVAADVWEP